MYSPPLQISQKGDMQGRRMLCGTIYSMIGSNYSIYPVFSKKPIWNHQSATSYFQCWCQAVIFPQSIIEHELSSACFLLWWTGWLQGLCWDLRHFIWDVAGCFHCWWLCRKGVDNSDFAHTRQRLLTCKIYHHILSSCSEMSFCQIGVLMQGDLSCLIFER